MCSADGKRWVVENGGDGAANVKVILGTFDGASTWTWTATPFTASGGTDYPKGFSLSKDGTKMLVSFAAHAHISTDFGASWNPLPTYPGTGTAMTASAMSGDGNTIAIVSDNLLYTSTKGGVSWVPATGLPPVVLPDTLGAPSISYDGSHMALFSILAGPIGSIYISRDGGASFTVQTGPGASGIANWHGINIQSR